MGRRQEAQKSLPCSRGTTFGLLEDGTGTHTPRVSLAYRHSVSEIKASCSPWKVSPLWVTFPM